VTRVVDRGAIVAAYVGIGMAVVIAISFLLVIPIEPVYWLLTPFAGLLIGYYANRRSDRRIGPWARIVANATYAGLITGLALAALLLGVKALFFFLDDGFREGSQGQPLACRSGAPCVYARYLATKDGGTSLAAEGVTDVDSFTAFYWRQQLTAAGTLLVVATATGLGGGLAYGMTRPGPRPESRPAG
jgi:hypothetical protein